MSARRNRAAERNLPELIRGGALTVNGERLPLLSGEVHFFRMDPESWDRALHQLKAARLPMVSTYLSWRRFSTGADRYDLEGRTDPRLNVRRFLDLCARHGLWVTMKPGPWICAEEPNGGYPDWLVEKRELHVLDADGRSVMGYNHPFQSPIPSYLHPVYLEHVRKWLSEVDTALFEYFHPRGPILLVQLDNEPSMTFHDKLFESDYNPVNVGENGLYQKWLQEKYSSIANLNKAHHSSWRTFQEVPAPRALKLAGPGELAACVDWAEYKEHLMVRHIECIRRMHEENGLDRVLFTINYNEHPQLGVPNDWHALELASGIGGFDYYPRLPLSEAGLADVALFTGYSRVCNVIPWSPEIMCGTWSFLGQEHAHGALAAADFEYLYLCCVALGLRGMNFYMFADRDNWIDSPLDVEGRPGPTTEAVRTVIRLISEEPELERLHRRQEVAVLYYRPSAREAFVAAASSCQPSLSGSTLGSSYRCFRALFSRLHSLNCDPAIVDPWIAPEKVRECRLIFVPEAPGMDESTLSILDDFAAAGGIVVSVNPEAMPSEKELRGILESKGIRPEVMVDVPGVYTVMHSLPERSWLFVINSTEKVVAVELGFRDGAAAGMTVFPVGGETVRIEAAKVRVSCRPRSVQVWRVDR